MQKFKILRYALLWFNNVTKKNCRFSLVILPVQGGYIPVQGGYIPVREVIFRFKEKIFFCEKRIMRPYFRVFKLHFCK